MTDRSRVVVTGIGLVTPLGTSAEETWSRSARGESGIAELTRFDATDHRCRSAAEVGPFDLAPRLRNPKSQKYMNRSVTLGLLAAKQAVEASGAELSTLDPYRVGVYIGSGETGLEHTEFFRALSFDWRDSDRRDFGRLGGRASRLLDPYFSIRTLSNSGIAFLSSEFDAQGPGANFVHGDTASAHALASAADDVAEGRCDVALAGGYDGLLNVATYLAYEGAGLLSPTGPERAYRPFDRARDGIVLGEAAGFFVLERLEDARRRGAPVVGEIAGFGAAAHPLDTDPFERDEGVLAAAMHEALGDGPDPDFVIGCGIGGDAADRSEAAALGARFDRRVPVAALKSQTGYLGAATAVVEAGLGLLALEHGQIPPIARLEDPEFPLDFVTGAARPIEAGTGLALSVSRSWGGQCAAFALRRFVSGD